MLLLLPFFIFFGFNRLLFLEHLLFWLLIVGGNNNYYINWHIVDFRQFKCCCGIKINKFSFEHVLYLNFFGGIILIYVLHYNKLYKDKWIGIFPDLTSWVLVLVTYSIDLIVTVGTISYYVFLHDRFPLNDRFYHNWYRLMLI
jgi:hypothetical protein